MTVYIEILAEFAFNTIMITYLVQPYRDAKAEHRSVQSSRPSKAIKVMVGREDVPRTSINDVNINDLEDSNDIYNSDSPRRKPTVNFPGNVIDTEYEE